MSENLASAVNEVRYYEKRKYNVAVKAAECFPRDRIASSAAEFLCNAGHVIKNSRTGCDQKIPAAEQPIWDSGRPLENRKSRTGTD